MIKIIIKKIEKIDRKIWNYFDKSISNNDEIPKIFIFSLKIWLNIRSKLTKIIIEKGILYPNEGLPIIMNMLLTKGSTFIDIGANVGTISERASYLVGVKGKVYSFEPSPSTVKILHKRIEVLNLKNVVVNECGISNYNGSSILYEFKETFGAPSSLRPGAWPGHTHNTETVVQIKTLDEYVAEANISKIDLIKIDVQGSEIDVLRGSKILLQMNERPILFIELERDATKAFGKTINELLEVIYEIGYEAYSWRGNGFVNIRTEEDLPETGHDDVVCMNKRIHNKEMNKLKIIHKINVN